MPTPRQAPPSGASILRSFNVNRPTTKMLLGTILPYLMLLLTKVTSTLQVDITIRFAKSDYIDASVEFTCSEIKPGQCCSLSWLHPLEDLILTVRFDHLIVSDIAAVWGVWLPNEHTRQNDACKGEAGATRTGPGTWTWDVLQQPESRHLAAKGASYITLPRTLPPSSATIKWLAVEGIVGLLWGKGSWFASPRIATILSGDNRAPPSRVNSRSRLRRDIRSLSQGRVWATPPPLTVYPDLILLRGIQYRDGGAGNLVYNDGNGVMLNLTHISR